MTGNSLGRAGHCRWKWITKLKPSNLLVSNGDKLQQQRQTFQWPQQRVSYLLLSVCLVSILVQSDLWLIDQAVIHAVVKW